MCVSMAMPHWANVVFLKQNFRTASGALKSYLSQKMISTHFPSLRSVVVSYS